MNQPAPLPEGDIQRWTAKRKAAVVLDLIRGKTTAADAARQHGHTPPKVAELKEVSRQGYTGTRIPLPPWTRGFSPRVLLDDPPRL